MSVTDAPFALSVSASEGAVAVVAVGGELDLSTSPRLRHLLLDLVRVQGKRELVLDCTDLTFLDSTAVGVLVTVQRDLAADGGRLVVRGASNAARRVFAITGLDRAIVLEG